MDTRQRGQKKWLVSLTSFKSLFKKLLSTPVFWTRWIEGLRTLLLFLSTLLSPVFLWYLPTCIIKTHFRLRSPFESVYWCQIHAQTIEHLFSKLPSSSPQRSVSMSHKRIYGKWNSWPTHLLRMKRKYSQALQSLPEKQVFLRSLRASFQFHSNVRKRMVYKR